MICSHYKILKVSLLYIIVFSEQFPCSPVNNNNSFLLDFLHLNYVLIFENIWFVLINNMDYNQIFFITFLLRIYSIEVSAPFNYFSYLSGWFILIRMARVSLKLFFLKPTLRLTTPFHNVPFVLQSCALERVWPSVRPAYYMKWRGESTTANKIFNSGADTFQKK